MKILIVKLSALGDVVHALPVLAYLHAVVPEAEVDWLVEEGFVPLLEGHPLLNRVIPAATRRWRKEGARSLLKGVRSLAASFRHERYDLVLDLQGNSKSGFFTWLTRAPQRYGFDRSGVREWPNLLATRHKVKIPAENHHISSRYLQIARAAFPGGTDVPLCGPLAAQPDAKRQVEQMLAERGLVPGEYLVAHYGTTWDTKLWSLEHWCELGRVLTVEQGRKLVLTWGNDVERDATERVAEACQGQAVIWPRGTLPELVALLAAARLTIGSDTGPVHIAAALGRPTVSIFRVTDSLRNGPHGDGHIRLQAPMPCSPCLRKNCEMDHECAMSIPVEDVCRSIDVLLDRGHPAASGERSGVT